ncbi:MAG: hypothetical protein Q9170_006252 [Blastenia crenularia]
MTAERRTRPRVFFDIQSGADYFGRIVIELFGDKTPKSSENFRAICTSSHNSHSLARPLTYKSSPFHRIIDEFMIQGGDITAGNGTGGTSIYGKNFEDENIGWRKIDAPGLLCMANRGKDTNNSQFFITLAPCEHLNGKHTVFGHVVKGMVVCERMAKVSNGAQSQAQSLQSQKKSRRESVDYQKSKLKGILEVTAHQAIRPGQAAALNLRPDVVNTANAPIRRVEEVIQDLMRTVEVVLLPAHNLHKMFLLSHRHRIVNGVDVVRRRPVLHPLGDRGRRTSDADKRIGTGHPDTVEFLGDLIVMPRTSTETCPRDTIVNRPGETIANFKIQERAIDIFALIYKNTVDLDSTMMVDLGEVISMKKNPRSSSREEEA